MSKKNMGIAVLTVLVLVAAVALTIAMVNRNSSANSGSESAVKVSQSPPQPTERGSEVGGVYDDDGKFLEDDAGVPKPSDTDDVSDEESRDAAQEAIPDDKDQEETKKIAIDWAKNFFDTDKSMEEWVDQCKENSSPQLIETLETIDPVKIPDAPPNYDQNVLLRSSDMGRFTYQIDGASKGDAATSLLVVVQMNKGEWQVQDFDWTNTNF